MVGLVIWTPLFAACIHIKALATSQPGAVAVGARLTKDAVPPLSISTKRVRRPGPGVRRPKITVADRAPAQRCRDRQISPIAGPSGLAAVQRAAIAIPAEPTRPGAQFAAGPNEAPHSQLR